MTQEELTKEIHARIAKLADENFSGEAINSDEFRNLLAEILLNLYGPRDFDIQISCNEQTQQLDVVVLDKTPMMQFDIKLEP